MTCPGARKGAVRLLLDDACPSHVPCRDMDPFSWKPRTSFSLSLSFELIFSLPYRETVLVLTCSSSSDYVEFGMGTAGRWDGRAEGQCMTMWLPGLVIPRVTQQSSWGVWRGERKDMITIIVNKRWQGVCSSLPGRQLLRAALLPPPPFLVCDPAEKKNWKKRLPDVIRFGYAP